MNAKYALALILTLQVSMCLCESATPTPEVREKYQNLKTKLAQRFKNLFDNLPETTIDWGVASEFTESVKNNDKFKVASHLASNIGEDINTGLDTARTFMLGYYEQNLREHLMVYIENFIKDAQFFLDIFLPA